MSSINKEECPTCGASINVRVIEPSTALTRALYRAMRYCRQVNRHEFKRSELNGVIKAGTEYANFAYWIDFGRGMMYRPDGKKSYWGFNLQRIDAFFRGEWMINLEIHRKYHGSKQQDETIRQGFIKEIKNVSDFLDTDGEYLSEYRSEPEQRSLI